MGLYTYEVRCGFATLYAQGYMGMDGEERERVRESSLVYAFIYISKVGGYGYDDVLRASEC